MTTSDLSKFRRRDAEAMIHALVEDGAQLTRLVTKDGYTISAPLEFPDCKSARHGRDAMQFVVAWAIVGGRFLHIRQLNEEVITCEK